MAHDVFISYSTEDKPIADGICANLEAAGLRCWIAPRDIDPGDDRPSSITRAISACRVMVLVFSQNANQSEDISRELYMAATDKVIIVPFKIEDVQPEAGKAYYLGRTHWLDAMNPPTLEQIGQLVDRIQSILAVEPDRKETPSGNAVKSPPPFSFCAAWPVRMDSSGYRLPSGRSLAGHRFFRPSEGDIFIVTTTNPGSHPGPFSDCFSFRLSLQRGF